MKDFIIGEDNFQLMRQNNAYYVDKTAFLSEFLRKGKNNIVTLITRPRRFGKTLNMSMFDSFLDITQDNSKLFEGLAVSEDKELCNAWLNQYPCIFISLKFTEGNSFDEAMEALGYTLAKYLEKYSFLADEESIGPSDKEFIRRLTNGNASKSDIIKSLEQMSKILHQYHGKPVVILIDEYDVPISCAYKKGYYDEMMMVIRGMFSVALKGNPHLKFAVLTGCLRIAKESIFTGMNNLVSFSILDNTYAEYFGFTEFEIDKILSDFNLTDKKKFVKEWYNGYTFGKTNIYCPWDVVNYISAVLKDPDVFPKNYWLNTSHNAILRSFVDKTEWSISSKFEKLLNGKAYITNITDDLTYDELYNDESNLWSMLLLSGYLTLAEPKNDNDLTALKIPNKEVEEIFRRTVVKWFKDNIDRTVQNSLMAALWKGDFEKASEQLSLLLRKTISYHDYKEDFYHAFLAGVFNGIGYDVESNKEHGLGRPDLVVSDAYNQRALVFEVKHCSKNEILETKCKEAINQIIATEYFQDFWDDDFETILCYGIAFKKKKCMIRKVDLGIKE